MNKNDLIAFCRYYKGQKENPYTFKDHKYTAWKIERLYVQNYLRNDDTISDFVVDYVRHEMTDFHKEDDVPMTLKAFLMNRFFQYNDREDVQEFKKFYELLYK